MLFWYIFFYYIFYYIFNFYKIKRIKYIKVFFFLF